MMGIGNGSDRAWVISEDEAEPIIRAAVEGGVTFFDTADTYSAGASEIATGRLVSKFLTREEAVIATKVFMPMTPGENGRGLNKKHVFAAIDASLSRLGMDYVDLYQIHRWDYRTPIEETMEALHAVLASGKARYIGASSMFAWQFAKAQFAAERHGLTKFISMQNHYNLIYREEEREMIPQCVDQGVGVIPWSPLAGGILGGVLPIGTGSTASQGSARRTSKDLEDRVRLIRPQLELWEALCHDLGSAPAQVAIAWLLSNPAVTAPIIGPRTLDQLTGVVAALDLSLEPEVLEKLDTIFPGPGGPAPEAYAW